MATGYRKQVNQRYLDAYDKGAPNLGNLGQDAERIARAINAFGTAAQSAANRLKEDVELDTERKINTKLAEFGGDENKLLAYLNTGEDKELSGFFRDKVVSQYKGRLTASNSIRKLKENYDKYDMENETFQDFAKNYVPSFQDKNDDFIDGYNSYWQKEFYALESKDFEARMQKSELTKFNSGSAHLSNILMNSDKKDAGKNFWQETENLGLRLPNVNGKTNYLFDNDEKKVLAIQVATNILNTATTMEELDRAIQILTTDRGDRKSGGALGSLVDTADETVMALYGKLLAKQDSLQSKDLRQKKEKIQLEVLDIYSQYAEFKDDPVKMAELRTRLQLVSPLEVAKWDRMTENDSKIENLTAIEKIKADIMDGTITSAGQITDRFDAENLSISLHLNDVLTFYNNYSKYGGAHLSDVTYQEEIKELESTLKNQLGSSPFAALGSDAPKLIRAMDYFKNSYYEELDRREKEGKSWPIREKIKFMREIREEAFNLGKADDMSLSDENLEILRNAIPGTNPRKLAESIKSLTEISVADINVADASRENLRKIQQTQTNRILAVDTMVDNILGNLSEAVSSPNFDKDRFRQYDKERDAGPGLVTDKEIFDSDTKKEFEAQRRQNINDFIQEVAPGLSEAFRQGTVAQELNLNPTTLQTFLEDGINPSQWDAITNAMGVSKREIILAIVGDLRP
tara:strand:- start:1787 stop:3853 length:2067 start_codon:yes stop_codon:yes gene_type:complete